METFIKTADPIFKADFHLEDQIEAMNNQEMNDASVKDNLTIIPSCNTIEKTVSSTESDIKTHEAAVSESSYQEESDDSVKDKTYAKSSPSSCSSSSSSKSDSSDNEAENNENKDPENHETKKITRKRTRGPENWKKNLAKRLRNSGKEYVNVKTKKSYAERQLKPPCGEKCKIKCYTKFSEEQHREIFRKYWEIGCVQRQRDFISSSMITIKPRYRKHLFNKKPQETQDDDLSDTSFEIELIMANDDYINKSYDLEHEATLDQEKPCKRCLKEKERQKIEQESTKDVNEYIRKKYGIQPQKTLQELMEGKKKEGNEEFCAIPNQYKPRWSINC
ncbi:unnamed protein product [Brassicogethes aeneus]|uniref:Uncharacterized protein n=1 Tax=Brassicogethes aeneus TaxID=1431903 RepID=A0A9P0API6_BRAAE|nr:unnamed protein product [Brassicogethes aeneus]